MTHSQETPDQSQKAEPLPETREPLKAYQRLSEKIQDAIEKGGLKVGDKLPPERALAETFGVSRNSVREAIRTLSEQGILKSLSLIHIFPSLRSIISAALPDSTK